MSDSERILAGAMSGTSADGVDVAIVKITGTGLGMSAKLICHRELAYEPGLRTAIFRLREQGSIGLAELVNLGRQISLTYGRAVREAISDANLQASDIAGVAVHGQTLFHAPPDTLQWIDPSLVAAETGCRVISDFRRADCAAGGQGAPLVPFADYILFRHPTKTRVLLNIGGIANVTWLKPGGTLDDVIAFDTGPGNCVIDHVCRKEFPHGPGYDPDGQLSRGTLPSKESLAALLGSPYFHRKPPKSTDGPAMIELFESHRELRNGTFFQRASGATLFAMCSIQQQIMFHLGAQPDELIISGGGTKNSTMMHHMKVWMKGAAMTTDDLGVPSQSKEAIAFALLGAATLDNIPSNVPSATGATRAVVLGSMTPIP